MSNQKPAPNGLKSRNRLPYIFGTLALCILGLYFILQGDGKEITANACEKDQVDITTLADLRPLAKGKMAAFQVFDKPKMLPELSFKDKAGNNVSLTDFKGKTVLLNLWATWCVPCREEMPALEKLQSDKAGVNFTVLPVNIDTQGIDKPARFYEKTGLKALPFYTDDSTDIFITLKKNAMALGMPTTILVSKSGCALGLLHGPAHWSGENAYALIDAVVK